MELAASLRDEAVVVLALTEPERRTDYHTLTTALEARFEQRNQTKIHRAALRTRTRKRGEPAHAGAGDHAAGGYPVRVAASCPDGLVSSRVCRVGEGGDPGELPVCQRQLAECGHPAEEEL